MPSLDQIESLLSKDPGDVFLNFAKAMELSRLGRTDESVAQFDRVVELDASYCPAHFQKGRTLLAAGRDEDARSALRCGIETAERTGDHHAAGEMSDLLDSI